ncbi:molybdopterin molybdotransferase MoeA [uncultured Sphingomonas sp.]|uniref:molybdopterin molybdotransferase MoeA n=1 Tax=uncultured Sphingomonas sp. TaxID=158754 RepID=UPI0025D78E57|nr:molybdopterin molybdotransferase MoeA [uncultured Sphingomonas sp.]
MIAFDEALALATASSRPLGREQVALEDAHGRVLAEPLIAQVSAPPTDVSAMDGYAIREADLCRLPVRLIVAGESFAGAPFYGTIAAGTCARIFTGAPVPAGADRVIVQEIVERDGTDAVIVSVPGSARHIRKACSDFRAGDVLLPAGTLLEPRQLIAAAAADLPSLAVCRRPRLMVLSTGDELAEPGTARHRSDRIPESVSFGVAALAREWGAEYLGSVALPDRLEEMQAAAALALRDADVVVVTGGASVGARDFAKQMFVGLDLVFGKVAIKPGKPVWLGRAKGRIVLGLPGNPTSAMVTARLFLAPLLAGLTGREPGAALRWRRATLSRPLCPVGQRETFARGVREDDGVRVMDDQDSSSQKTLAQCELLVRLRPGSVALEAGTLVQVLDF